MSCCGKLSNVVPSLEKIGTRISETSFKNKNSSGGDSTKKIIRMRSRNWFSQKRECEGNANKPYQGSDEEKYVRNRNPSRSSSWLRPRRFFEAVAPSDGGEERRRQAEFEAFVAQTRDYAEKRDRRPGRQRRHRRRVGTTVSSSTLPKIEGNRLNNSMTPNGGNELLAPNIRSGVILPEMKSVVTDQAPYVRGGGDGKASSTINADHQVLPDAHREFRAWTREGGVRHDASAIGVGVSVSESSSTQSQESTTSPPSKSSSSSGGDGVPVGKFGVVGGLRAPRFTTLTTLDQCYSRASLSNKSFSGASSYSKSGGGGLQYKMKANYNNGLWHDAFEAGGNLERKDSAESGSGIHAAEGKRSEDSISYDVERIKEKKTRRVEKPTTTESVKRKEFNDEGKSLAMTSAGLFLSSFLVGKRGETKNAVISSHGSSSGSSAAFSGIGSGVSSASSSITYSSGSKNYSKVGGFLGRLNTVSQIDESSNYSVDDESTYSSSVVSSLDSRPIVGSGGKKVADWSEMIESAARSGRTVPRRSDGGRRQWRERTAERGAWNGRRWETSWRSKSGELSAGEARF